MTEPALVQSDTVLQPLGRALVTGVYAAAKALRFYPIENATVQNSLQEVRRILSRLLEREGGIELRLVGDFMFLNEIRLRLDLTDYASFSFVSNIMRSHSIGKVLIEPGFEEQKLGALLLLLLQEGAGDDDAFPVFVERFEAADISHVEFAETHATGMDVDPEEADTSAKTAKLTYFQSVHVAKEVLTDARMGRAVNLRRVKRAVQTIVDQVLNNETSIMGMTALRDYDEYTFTHSVNVCIFSVVLGQRMGLSKLQLYELGLGALFHDIGKQRIAAEIVNKAGSLNDEEWAEIKRHPTEGLLMFFTMRGLNDVPYRAMLMAYEHHMKTDLSGYPVNKRDRAPTLFSRVVAAADGFDAATSKRSYQSEPWPPDEVMREMRDNPKRGFDPLLVKAFIHTTGVFPVGTTAILDTFELCVVTARNQDPEKVHQPVVKIVSDSRGIMLSEPIPADLSEVDPGSGQLKRSIVKTVDPDRYGVRVSDYFI